LSDGNGLAYADVAQSAGGSVSPKRSDIVSRMTTATLSPNNTPPASSLASAVAHATPTRSPVSHAPSLPTSFPSPRPPPFLSTHPSPAPSATPAASALPSAARPWATSLAGPLGPSQSRYAVLGSSFVPRKLAVPCRVTAAFLATSTTRASVSPTRYAPTLVSTLATRF